MKARFFALAALVLGLASCQTDFEGVSTNTGNEVDFQLAVATPELGATRADKDGRNGHDSAYGAIDYLTEEDWKNVDLRYSLEVYDFNEEGYVGATPVKDRLVQIVDKYEPITFDLRLVPNRRYHFVVFADFVPQDSWNNNELSESVADQTELGLRHNIGNNLGQITLTEDAINDEYTDAYFASKDITITNSSAQDIELTRPYGKVRVIATDLAELNLNVDPKSVKVTYDAFHANTFNAVTGEISGEYKPEIYNYTYNDGVCKESLANHYYTEGYDNFNPYGITNENGDERHTHMTLFTDYILATDTQKPIHFKMEVFDHQGCIKETHFITEIPVQRNHLTTIIGNVLTTATEINITIDDNFENQDRQYYVFEAFANVEGYKAGVNDGIVTLDRDYVIGNPIYVRSGINAVLNLNGFTIENTAKNGYTDVIIVEKGATLTINGEGTIKAVDGNDGYAVIADGEVTINGGRYEAGVDANGEANAVIYTRGTGGKVFINGGYFPNEAKSSFVLNKKDADRATTTIEVRGGTFEYFDPMNNTAEGTETNFVASGFASTLEGEHTYVVRPTKDYEIDGNTVYAYTANGLLKWSYESNVKKNNMNLEIMTNINMPMFTVEEDAANETYKYTETPVTIDANGKPDGSNWVQVGTHQPVVNTYIDRVVHGNGYTLKNVTMLSSYTITGFIGRCMNVEITDLNFDNATIYSTGSYIAPIAYVDDGSYIYNINVRNSYIYGNSNVAGISAEAMDHYDDPDKAYIAEWMANPGAKRLPVVTIEKCTTDANTKVVGKGNQIAGIIAQAYGCLIINCHNKANISGNGQVGGIAGYFRDYFNGQYGYIVNCTSTDCTIKSTGARVGGIAGYVMEGHDGSAWVVGCYSNSTIECTKSNVGSIVGYLNGTNKILGCYAISTRSVSGYGTASDTSFSFASEAAITAENFAKMNEGIAEYNTFAASYLFPESPVCAKPMVLPTCTRW